MSKYDLEQLAQQGKDQINITRTRINRKLEDLSFSTVFGKQMLIHCGAAILCIILLCVIMSSILGLNCRNDTTEMVTDAAMNIVDIKNQKLSLSQDMAKINKEMLNASMQANENGFIDDSICVLYNITQQTVEKYTSVGIQSNSDRLDEWYQEQTGDLIAEPIFNLPKSLHEFTKRHEGKTLVITTVRFENNVLIPEVVEARAGKRLIDTWVENEGLDPNRLVFNNECPIIIAGAETDSPLLEVVASHQFEVNSKDASVNYDKSNWPSNIKIATKRFSANNMDYEVSLIYQYAGLRPIMLFIILASAIILGVAIVTSVVQTKKIREF